MSQPKDNFEEQKKWFHENREIFKGLTKKWHNIIEEILTAWWIEIHNISSRTKEISSFTWKIQSWKYKNPKDEVTDLSWVRIICYVEDDIKIIWEFIEKTFKIDKENCSDKSDELGNDKVWYKSIHYVVELNDDRIKLPEYEKFKWLKLEIQVRTILQHAWAEVEHDRSYKFSWKLPDEIDRRFKLLAWTLELVDREFNNIAREIDKVSKKVKKDTKDWNLDYEINSTTLKEYLLTKLQKVVPNHIIPEFWPDNSWQNEILEELKMFWLNNLQDLDKIIPKDIIKSIRLFETEGSNFLWILRDLMIINNADQYFKNCNPDWVIDSLNDSYAFFKHYWKDTHRLISKYDSYWPI